MDLHKRLTAARKSAGFDTAKQAADALGIRYPTYAGHENGSSGFRRDTAAFYAKRFGVSLDWLITGRGEMKGLKDDPQVMRIAERFRQAPAHIQQTVLTLLELDQKNKESSKP